MTQQPFRLILWLSVVALMLQAGCATPSGPVQTLVEPSITVTDGLGRTVTLAAPAQHIVSLAPSNTEILYAIGAGSQVIARDEFSDFPPEAVSLPSIGGLFGKYNAEAILQLKPDLVLAAEINPPELVQEFEKLGLTVYMLSNPLEMESMYANLLKIAQLTGRRTEAQALIDSLKTRVASVEEKVKNIHDEPLVFYELDGSDPAKPYTFGPNTFLDILITEARGRNVGASLGSAWAQISVEELVAQDPDIILLGDSAYGVTPESVAERPGWSAIEAVKSDKVYPFDDNLISRPGPRLVEGLEKLVELLHPELTR